MNPDACELLRLRRVEKEGSSSPLDVVIGRKLRADLDAQAEAAGGAVELELCGGWRIGVSTEAYQAAREAAARAAFQKRMAARRCRRRRG